MRPERLELAGFGAFLEPTEVNFEGADLFALVGPTGAGKSTILDAIAFALYGSVSRYENPILVAPAIAARRGEARVRLDFSVAGVSYTAVRVVKRTLKGATTRDARLERGDEVLAADAKAVSQEVERLLGLSFDDFTKCVVLPQGAFARFLHDKPADRQEVLIGLLGLSIYDAVHDLAVGRRKQADQLAGVIEGRLGDLAAATEIAVAQARQRSAALAELAGRVAEAEPALHAAAADERRQLDLAEAAEGRASRLAAVRAPTDGTKLAAALSTARGALDDAGRAEAAAAEAGTSARLRLAEAGDRPAAERVLAALDQFDRLTAARAPLAADAVSSAQVRDAVGAALTESKRSARAAEQRYHDVQQANRAYALAAELAVGQSCPVCRQGVAVLPTTTAPDDYGPARTAHEEADAAAVRADAQATIAERAWAAAETKLAGHDAQLAEAAAVVAGIDRHAAANVVASVTAAESAVNNATDAEVQRRRLVDAARRRFDDTREAVDQAWRHYDKVRDTLAGLDPPPPTRADLGADWVLLAAWAGAQVPAERLAAEQARRATTDADRLAGERRQALADLLASHEIVLGAADAPGAAVAAAQGRAEADGERLAAALEQAGFLKAELDTVRNSAAAARLLALHLDGGHFEKWLLKEALDDLVEAATTTLRHLSGGGYSLVCDDKLELSVIDHANADERRPVRTLSGGETFLASLSLALALADRIAALAPGQVALESLFLDEGFGTLDPDTLDVVASAIEQLGAEGRMIGLVTHVRELAERVPVRFEVTKGPGGATIERVAS